MLEISQVGCIQRSNLMMVCGQSFQYVGRSGRLSVFGELHCRFLLLLLVPCLWIGSEDRASRCSRWVGRNKTVLRPAHRAASGNLWSTPRMTAMSPARGFFSFSGTYHVEREQASLVFECYRPHLPTFE
ncbi:hypothetical protein LX36DRAFT_456546 [Colletotrichum falcatum]|nr:hypothetical protein LX36DRAFT_456546 [Colletotrichum falcatum]